MNQGYVFECLNFAQVFKLPDRLVCENNGYGEYTPFPLGHGGRDLGARRGHGRCLPRRSTG
jgi:TPP-dependent pyruvate/acetoin dehydrogenase alpha subunit